MNTDDILAILREHTQSARNQRCSCGWRGDVSKSVIDPNSIYQQHRRHQAEIIAAALRNALRRAWAAGHTWCYDGGGEADNPYL